MTADVLAPAVITEPGIYQIPANEYHADPVPAGSLSSTGARLIRQEAGPAKYRWKLDHPGDDSTDVFDFGRAAHHKVLGDIDDIIAVLDFDSRRTNAYKAAAEEARQAGKTPILTGQWEVVEEMAAAIEANTTAANLLRASSGQPEQSLFWRDDETSVWCRARVDWLRTPVTGKRLIVVDYKTCEHADSERFSKAAADFGYHMQDDFYRRGVRAVGLDPDPAFVFVAQEKNPPYLVNVVQLNRTAQVIARNQNRGALHLFAECQRTGQWPGYGNGITELALPSWYERLHDEDGE